MMTLASVLNTMGITSSRITPFLPYDTGESFLLTTDGADALATWYGLRRAAPRTGFWPILLGDVDSYRAHDDHLRAILRKNGSNHVPVTSRITRSLAIDPLGWFRLHAQHHDRHSQSAYAAHEPPFVAQNDRVMLDAAPPVWRLQSDPYMVERNTFAIPTEVLSPHADDTDAHMRIQPAPIVYLALLPTQTAWHIPAYLDYGGVNDSPSVDGQLLVWRWWKSQYHAEIVGIAGNGIEAWVVAPPRDPQRSARLAWEHEVYCPDVITQVNDLPTDVTDAFVWRFWWN